MLVAALYFGYCRGQSFSNPTELSVVDGSGAAAKNAKVMSAYIAPFGSMFVPGAGGCSVDRLDALRTDKNGLVVLRPPAYDTDSRDWRLFVRIEAPGFPAQAGFWDGESLSVAPRSTVLGRLEVPAGCPSDEIIVRAEPPPHSSCYGLKELSLPPSRRAPAVRGDSV